MAKRVSPTAVGTFVVAGFALLVAVIVAVGAGHLFRKPRLFICMFKGDLNGLKVGAPVKVRGVQIGSVTAIKLRLSRSEGRLREGEKGLWLPVFVELDRTQLVAQGGTGEALDRAGFEKLLKGGLRAQLKTQSVLTGLLYVDLDLHPGTPLNLVIQPGSGPYMEIPTIPTQLETVQQEVKKALKRLERINFNALAASITNAANSIKDLATSPSLKATLNSLRETTANLNKTVVSIRAVVDNANRNLAPLVASLRKTADATEATMKQTRALFAELESTLDPDSPLSVHLNETLEQLTDTTRSIGELSDYLQRNPSALIRGKYIHRNKR